MPEFSLFSWKVGLEQETLPLRKSGDFFRKVIVTSGYAEPRVGKDGIVTVGVLPFLLDEKIYQSIVS